MNTIDLYDDEDLICACGRHRPCRHCPPVVDATPAPADPAPTGGLNTWDF